MKKKKKRSKTKYEGRNMGNNIIIRHKNEESPRKGKWKQKVTETCLYNWRFHGETHYCIWNF